MLSTLTQVIADVQDKLESSGDENWSEGKHLRACGKWALMGLLDTQVIVGTTLIVLIGVASVENKFKK